MYKNEITLYKTTENGDKLLQKKTAVKQN